MRCLTRWRSSSPKNRRGRRSQRPRLASIRRLLRRCLAEGSADSDSATSPTCGWRSLISRRDGAKAPRPKPLCRDAEAVRVQHGVARCPRVGGVDRHLALGALAVPARSCVAASTQRGVRDGRRHFGGRNASLALSPDGSVLAFLGENNGSRQLYIRPLEQLQAIPLPGTVGASLPFFSPDGQWIGFFAEGKLKKVAVSGGAAVPICDAPDPRGGAWGEDGDIVFSLASSVSSPRNSLLRVSSDGGTPQPATTLSDDEVTHRWPQVLPGARAILYTAHNRANNYADANIVVQTLPNGPRKILQRGGSFGRYVPSGHLVYVHDGTLFAAPFDHVALEVTGPGRPVIENIANKSCHRCCSVRFCRKWHGSLPTWTDLVHGPPDRMDDTRRKDHSPSSHNRNLESSAILAGWYTSGDGHHRQRADRHRRVRLGAGHADPPHVRCRAGPGACVDSRRPAHNFRLGSRRRWAEESLLGPR